MKKIKHSLLFLVFLTQSVLTVFSQSKPKMKEFHHIRQVGEYRIMNYLRNMEKLSSSTSFKELKKADKKKLNELRNDTRAYYFQPKWLKVPQDYLDKNAGRNLVNVNKYFSHSHLLNYFDGFNIAYDIKIEYDSIKWLTDVPDWMKTNQGKLRPSKQKSVTDQYVISSKVLRSFTGKLAGTQDEVEYNDTIFIYWGFRNLSFMNLQPEEILIYGVQAPPPIEIRSKVFRYDYWRNRPNEQEILEAEMELKKMLGEFMASLDIVPGNKNNNLRGDNKYFAPQQANIDGNLFPETANRVLSNAEFLEQVVSYPNLKHTRLQTQIAHSKETRNGIKFSGNASFTWNIEYPKYVLAVSPSANVHFSHVRTANGFQEFRITKIVVDQAAKVDTIWKDNIDSLAAHQAFHKHTPILIKSLLDDIKNYAVNGQTRSDNSLELYFKKGSLGIEVQTNCKEPTDRNWFRPGAYLHHLDSLSYVEKQILPSIGEISKTLVYNPLEKVWEGQIEFEQIFTGERPEGKQLYKDKTTKIAEIFVQKAENDWTVFIRRIKLKSCTCIDKTKI